MLNWKTLYVGSGILFSALFFSACGTTEETQPQPSVEPTVSPTADLDLTEEVAPEETATASSELEEETVSDPTRIPADQYADLEIVTLLPRDAIPAVDDPQFLSAAEADEFYDADELVIGVEFAGDARAYSIPYLSNREIVNDTVGGVKIAVTW